MIVSAMILSYCICNCATIRVRNSRGDWRGNRVAKEFLYKRYIWGTRNSRSDWHGIRVASYNYNTCNKTGPGGSRVALTITTTTTTTTTTTYHYYYYYYHYDYDYD